MRSFLRFLMSLVLATALSATSSAQDIASSTQAAEQGDAYAQWNLGVCYYYGNGVTKDISKARYWFQKAANQGHKEAAQVLRQL